MTPLQPPDIYVLLGLTVVLLIVSGLVILLARTKLEGKASAPAAGPVTGGATASDRSIVRSWLAIALVGALVLLCAASFGMNDAALRSSLIGGLVASAGAATAFYFASKASDQARQDILNASKPSVQVPELVRPAGTDLNDVNAALAALPLTLQTDPAAPDPQAKSVSQKPDALSSVPSNAPVLVSFAGPIPELSGKSPSDASAALQAARLELVADPPNPGQDTKVENWDPKAPAVPLDRKVTVSFK